MVLYAIDYRLWVSETAGLSGGIDGAEYLTLNSLSIIILQLTMANRNT